MPDKVAVHVSTDKTQPVLILASLDTKESEASYLASAVRQRGVSAEPFDMSPSVWVSEADLSLPRGEIMTRAADLIAAEVGQRYRSGSMAGLVVIGGATGAALGTPAFAEVPWGVPKVLVSPVVSGETTPYVGISDAVLIHPVVDFVGRNAYVDYALDVAASVAASLVLEGRPYPSASESSIAVTAFGVTSPLVEKIRAALEPEGTRLVVFSANGTGGRAFERFIAERLVFGAFDLTTSELADELFGGVLSAGPTRLTTGPRLHIPYVALPGAVDFINFGPLSTVPDHLRARSTICHTPSVTLVRTSPEENEVLARTFAERVRPGGEQVAVVVPLQGFSLVSRPRAPFYDPDADRAFIDTLISELGEDRVTRVDAPMNSDEVCEAILRVSSVWRAGRVAK